MIKFYSLILALLLVALITSCEKNKELPDTSFSEVDEVITVTEETEENTEVVYDEKLLLNAISSFDRSAKISETVIYNNADIEIVANNIEFLNETVKLALSITNNTEKALNFSCGSSACDVNSISGVMVDDGFLNCDVEAKTTINKTIEFSILSLIAYGISSVADIEIGFWVSGEEFDSFYTGPIGIDTSLANEYNYDISLYQNMFNDDTYGKMFNCRVEYYTNEKLYESQDGKISVISAAIVQDADGDTKALFEIKNTADEKVQAWGKETHINGELIKSYSSWIESINGGRNLIVSFPLSEYAEEYSGEHDVTKMKEFKFTLSTGKNSSAADDSGVVIITLNDEIELIP